MMTTMKGFNLEIVHPSWQSTINEAMNQMNSDYLSELYQNHNWLPGPNKIFNAFSLPKEKINYVLFGESPYPREASANGFAFWDAAVNHLWSSSGLSKEVNRATSLRNLIKMLLIAEGLLPADKTDQASIAKIDKHHLIQTNTELFRSFLNHGFLLLNATPVLRKESVRKDAVAWQPFIKCILENLFQENPKVHLILFGNIANAIEKLILHHTVEKLRAEHPYNISFIHNVNVLNFFRPLHLLVSN